MFTKKAYTLEEVMLYLEALEMLDMVYTIEKHMAYKEEGQETEYSVWIITYEQGEPLGEESAIQFED